MALTPWEQAVMGTVTVEQEIANRVVGVLLPALNNERQTLLSVQELWLENGMAAKVADALELQATTGQTQYIAGYEANDWAAWGVVLVETLAFLNTPIAGIGGRTPKQVLAKWYQKQA